jgi:hypothetical protein
MARWPAVLYRLCEVRGGVSALVLTGDADARLLQAVRLVSPARAVCDVRAVGKLQMVDPSLQDFVCT